MTPRLRSTSAILVAFAVPLGVYAASLRGDVSFWDTGDLQTVPYILGIPYPTGFPGFVLAGWLFSHLEPFGNVAWRMNLFTAIASAGAVAALVAALLTLGIGELVALGAGAVFAFTNLVWNHATYVDVHPVSFCAVAWGAVFALRWHRDGGRRNAAAFAVALTTALAFDNTTVLALPGLALIVVVRRPAVRPALAAAGLAVLVLCAVYAYLPLRSAAVSAAALDPTLLLGVAPGRPFWDDGHPASLAGFVRVVTGSEFAPHRAAFAMLGPQAFHRLLSDFAPDVQHDVGATVLWLALLGAGLLWWRAPLVFGGLVAFGVVPLLFIYAYPSESDPSRYFFPAYFALVAYAAYGAQALDALPRAPRVAAAVTGAALVAGVLFTDVSGSLHLFEQPSGQDASPFVNRVLAVTPPNAILVVPWLYATPLGYGAYVERRLGARIVLTAGPRQYVARYREWLAQRPVVIVSDDPVTVPGLRVRKLDVGMPNLYALR